jgi:two-component system chemotaxis sensor kinase CheA
MEFAEEIREFLIESNENLAALDQEIVELEKHPTDELLIASVFRTIHTIKGTSGFFGFSILGSITHIAENLLGQVREKQRSLTPELVSLVLQTVDGVKAILGNIEEHSEEGADIYQPLRDRLDAAFHSRGDAPGAAQGGVEASAVPVAPGTTPAVDAASAASPAENGVAAEVESEPEEYAEAVPATESAPVAERATSNGSLAASSTIRVDVNLLDKLMNLVGELVLARNQILQGSPANSVASNGASQRLNLITSELQEGVMRARMQPIGVVWNKLPRVVRDLASAMGKKIEIQMEGAETELDKTIIEAIKDPLTHIVRNSCDHGIESPEVRAAKGKNVQGTILLRAYHEGGHVNIEISDDGAGIDPERVKSKAVQKGLVRPEQAALLSEWEALRLIFLPGFSTAEKVTSISGRGVGMDVVRTNIEKIGGAVDLANRSGAGSTIKIKIPLTLAIIPGLTVSVHSSRMTAAGEVPREHRFVSPQANLLELVRLEGPEGRKQIDSIHGAEVYRRRGKLLPLTHLSRVLGLIPRSGESDVMNIVIVQAEETAFGLVVDQVNDTQEIVVKALGKQLKSLSCYVGATIMGDGKIALILDVLGLAHLAKMMPQPVERAQLEARRAEAVADAHEMLLFCAGRFPRLVVPLSLVARLENFPSSRIEHASGAPVLRYRDAILPLVSLGGLLDPGSPDRCMEGESLQVIVFSEGSSYVGMVVDEILDIVTETVTIRRPSASFGMLGSGVVGGKVTDFVDLGALLAATGGQFESLQAGPEKSRRLLLIEPSKMARGTLRSYLEMNGHQVLEAASCAAALEILGRALQARTPVDLVVTSVGSPGPSDGLLEALCGHAALETVPVIGLAGASGDQPGDGARFDDWIARADREGLLRSIRSLTAFAGQHSETGPSKTGQSRTGQSGTGQTGTAPGGTGPAGAEASFKKRPASAHADAAEPVAAGSWR